MKNKRVWFRAKTMGWGWYPATWEGWLISLIFAAVFLNTTNFFQITTNSFPAFLKYFLPSTIIILILFIWITKKTSEKTN